MEEAEIVSILSRKELRKQKLAEYLAEKRRQKQPIPSECRNKKSDTSQKDFKGKENQGPNQIRKVTTSQAIKPSGTKALGLTSKINVKSNVLTERQNSQCPPASSRSAKTNTEPRLSKNVSSKTNAVGQFKTQTVRKTQVSGARDPSCTKAGGPVLGSGRVNHGPLVKTKTGLIPAVTNTRSSSRPKTVDDASIASSVPVSQKFVMAQKKSLPVTAVHKAINTRPTSATQSANAALSKLKFNWKPPMGKSQLSSQGVPLSGVKYVPPKDKPAPAKSLRKEVISRTAKSACKEKLQPAVGEEKNNKLQPVRVVQPSKYKERVTTATGANQKAASEPRKALGNNRDTQKKEMHISDNALKPQAHGYNTSVSVSSRRLPPPARSMGNPRPAVVTKTPKQPVRVFPKTEVRKVTAAQEERMRKLKEWREAKGISYKRPAMPVKPQVKQSVEISQPFWTAMKEEDDAHSLISAVDRSLDDCIKLLKEGCPSVQVKQVLSRLPSVSQKFAKYWICQVRLMEQENNLDVLPVFEEAVRVVLEPVDELRTVVFEIMKKKDTLQASKDKEKGQLQVLTPQSSPENQDNGVMTPKPGRVLLTGEKGASSVVKYKITATPGQKGKPTRLEGQVIRFLTPVRRSVRIERSSISYPECLQDHDVCVSSIKDLVSEVEGEKREEENEGNVSPSTSDTPMYIYRQNEALEDKVSVQLVYD